MCDLTRWHPALRYPQVHASFYRCIVIHGTDSAFVSRNVMYDAIGNCLYFEAGALARQGGGFPRRAVERSSR